MTPTSDTSTRRLIQELAEIEDRMYALRAARTGSPVKIPVDRELMRLAGREEQVLSQLRRQRVNQ